MQTGDFQIYIPNLDFCLEMQTYTSSTSQIFPFKSPTGPPNLAHTNTSLCSLPQWHYHPSFAVARSNSVILLSITLFSHCLGPSNSISKGMSALFFYFLTIKMLQIRIYQREQLPRTYVRIGQFAEIQIFFLVFSQWLNSTQILVGQKGNHKARTALGVETDLQRRHSSVEPSIRVSPLL